MTKHVATMSSKNGDRIEVRRSEPSNLDHAFSAVLGLSTLGAVDGIRTTYQVRDERGNTATFRNRDDAVKYADALARKK